jgi:hypothetical protein
MSSLHKLENKSERKRGRPPKNMIVSKPIKQIVDKKDSEEQLVLYLPNFNDDKNKTDNEFLSVSETETKNKFKHLTENISDQSESESESESESNSESESDSDKNNKEIISDSDTDIVDSNKIDKKKKIQEKNKNIKDKKERKRNINIEKLIEELHKKDAIIMTLKSKLKDKSLYNENSVGLTKDNKKKLMNIGLISVNNNKLQIAEKSDIACWWCTHNFDSLPLFLPEHYKDDKYFVFGNFCSFSCMLAYNDNLDDYRKSVRSSLIKQLYRDIFGENNMYIKPAGPRELLKKFGGILDITEYRDPNNVCKKNYKMTIPPMIPLLSEYDEIVMD